MKFGEIDTYHRPTLCTKCNGVMVFKGVGEYRCEDCGYVDYDDYGKVRLFIEQHAGATAFDVEVGTGVSQKTIRQMLKDNRLEIASESVAFLHCEMCGTNIRSGRFCAKCERLYHEKLEDEQRKKKSMHGFGKSDANEDGARRFVRKQ